MAEFDPKSERHYPLLIIKAVEPGCTTEIQIEDPRSGEILARLTTTDCDDEDDETFEAAVSACWRKVWAAYQRNLHETGDAALR